MAYQEKPLRGKWTPPSHIPQLDESIEDYDLWFYQMHQYLLQSCITNPADQRYLTQLHCDGDFFEAIVTRAKSLGIAKRTLCGSRRTFRDFVCANYTRPEALREIQDGLRDIAKKDLSVKGVWQELRPLFMSHDAKAKRQGYPELTDQQKVDYLIDGIQPRIKFLMSWLRRQRHPDLATPSTAYSAALSCEKDLQKLDSKEQDTSTDTAWLSSANVPKHTHVPILSQRPALQQRSSISQSNLVKNQSGSPLVPTKQMKPTASEVQRPLASTNLITKRRKRAFDNFSHQVRNQCAFCLNKGHTALNCRKRRRALEIQLKGQGASIQVNRPQHPTAFAAPLKKAQDSFPEQKSQIRTAPQSQRLPAGLGQRPAVRPTCNFCHKFGHVEDKCWIKYPHLKPQFPRQPGAIPLQGRLHSEAGHAAESHLRREEIQQAAFSPWREPLGSQPNLTSLALVSAQSSSENRPRRTASDVDSEADEKTKVREQPLCRCLPTLRATANNIVLHIIIDTGATINLMNTAIAKVMHTRATVDPVSVSDISGNLQKLSEIATVPMELNRHPYVFDFYITPTLPGDALLGMDAIVDAGWIIDPIDRILLHKTHALPPIQLYPCIHKAHRLRMVRKCTLAPMTWHRVQVYDKHSYPVFYSNTCLLLPSPPPILPICGAPTFHNITDSQKFILICNMSSEPIEIPADASIAVQEEAQDLGEEPAIKEVSQHLVESTTTTQITTRDKNLHPQADKLKSGNQQLVEKHFDLTSAKRLWDIQFVKALKRLLLTMMITWANPDTVGRTSKGEHHINTQDARPIALPLRRIAWIEKDKIKQEVEKMKQQGIIEDSESL